MKRRLRRIVLSALLALSFTFGLAMVANATTPMQQSAAADAYRVRAQEKIARLSNSRITQEQREAAAAQMKLMEGLSAIGSGSAASRAAGRSPWSSAASAAPGPGRDSGLLRLDAQLGVQPAAPQVRRHAAGPGPQRREQPGTVHPGREARHDHVPGLRLLRDRAAPVHGADALRPARRRRLRGYVQVNKEPTRTATTRSTRTPSTTSARSSSPTRTVRCASSSPTSCRPARRATCSSRSTRASWAPARVPIAGKKYTQNRATLHLHGGLTPWISDGTPHQWITPAAEVTSYPERRERQERARHAGSRPGLDDVLLHQPAERAADVLPRPLLRHHAPQRVRGRGRRLHDHGRRREEAHRRRHHPERSDPAHHPGQDVRRREHHRRRPTRPGTGAPTPTARRTTGDLWVPHVYVPAQNPAMPDGINPTGRWHYGPWFWPPVTRHHPGPGRQPVLRPRERPVGVRGHARHPATRPWAWRHYNDTPIVNGTAYPVLEVEPKSYRLRILNAANDRFFNLQMYVADPTVVTADGRRNTEVKMIPAEVPKNTVDDPSVHASSTSRGAPTSTPLLKPRRTARSRT